MEQEELRLIFSKLYWQLGPLILKEANELLSIQMDEMIHLFERQIEQMKLTDRQEVKDKIKRTELEIMLVQAMKPMINA